MERLLLTYQGSTAGQILAKLPAKATGKTSAQLKECIRLIVNETDGKILMRSMKKNTLSAVSTITDETYTHVLQLADNTLNLTGKVLSIKVDFGEDVDDIVTDLGSVKTAVANISTNMALNSTVAKDATVAKEATVSGVSGSLGTDSTTVHAKLTALATALSTLSTQIVTTAPYAKEATLGTPSDAKTVGTVFGKIANLLDVLSSLSTELGTDANHVAVQTKLDALLNALGECSFERNNDGADTWTLVLDRMSSVNNNILDV